MKLRIRKYYYQFNAPYYNIECLVDGHWLSVCRTAAGDKELALALKNTCLKALENGTKIWFNK